MSESFMCLYLHEIKVLRILGFADLPILLEVGLSVAFKGHMFAFHSSLRSTSSCDQCVDCPTMNCFDLNFSFMLFRVFFEAQSLYLDLNSNTNFSRKCYRMQIYSMDFTCHLRKQ